MINFVCFFFVLLTIGSISAEEKKISLEGVVRPEQFIGYLGIPVGTVSGVTGRVKIVSLDKGSEIRYFVVTHIGGKKLKNEVTFDLWSASLPEAKHGELVSAKAYERIMMLGRPKGVDGPRFPGTSRDNSYSLYRYIHILPEKKYSE